MYFYIFSTWRYLHNLPIFQPQLVPSVQCHPPSLPPFVHPFHSMVQRLQLDINLPLMSPTHQTALGYLITLWLRLGRSLAGFQQKDKMRCISKHEKPIRFANRKIILIFWPCWTISLVMNLSESSNPGVYFTAYSAALWFSHQCNVFAFCHYNPKPQSIFLKIYMMTNTKYWMI